MASETLEIILRGRDLFSPVARQVKGELSGIQRAGASLNRYSSQIGQGIKTSFLLASAGVGILAANIGRGLDSLVELERLQAVTAAAIKSTGGAAGLTADQIRTMAERLEDLTTVDDKVIQQAANVLLTFAKVRKDAFEPTLEVALDMSRALGTDLQGSLIQIGKAMQDPIIGLTALRRVGVSFDAQQTARIKKLAEEGKLYEAQDLILAELQKEFGGVARAAAETTEGSVNRFRDAIEDSQKSLATAFLPVLRRVSDALTTFLRDPVIQQGLADFGNELAGLFTKENIDKGIGLIKEAAGAFRDILPGLKEAASVTGQVISTAVGLFKSLPPDLQKVAIAALAVNKLTGGLVTSVVKDLLSIGLRALTTINAATVTVIGKVVNAPGVGGGGAGVAGAVGAAITTAGAAAIGITAANEIENVNRATGNIVTQRLDFASTATLKELTTALHGLQTLPDRLSPFERVLFAYNAGNVRETTAGTARVLSEAIATRLAPIINNTNLTLSQRVGLIAEAIRGGNRQEAMELNELERTLRRKKLAVTVNTRVNNIIKMDSRVIANNLIRSGFANPGII